MIPRKIHYCWFGNNALPKSAQDCISSWKRFLPEYEIVRWDESNFDVNQNAYVQEAYKAKKWAFVSDFARMKILYENGGLYFDTDVELIKSLDEILRAGAYLGCERDGGDPVEGIWVNPGLGMAAEAGNPIFKDVLDGYADAHYIMPDGSCSNLAIIERTTKSLLKHGLKNMPGLQVVCGITIYPKDYFCPISYLNNRMNLTENTVSIHHFSETWVSPYRRFRRKVTIFLGDRIMGHLRRAKSCVCRLACK
jgi:hypothetical protein